MYMDDEQNLIKVLKDLCCEGPIDAIGSGSNSVGKTMQFKLGVDHSVSKRNALFNHTITATQASPSSSGRTNLFACVPDWSNSILKSSTEIVDMLGKENVDKGYAKSLFCTVTSLHPNGFGLYLKVDPANKSLEEWKVIDGEFAELVSWSSLTLDARLSRMGSSAIVRANPVDLNGRSAFHYRYVDILGPPNLDAFYELLDDGVITIDHLISLKYGRNSAREQGPLFKIRADCREELFGNVNRIDLLDL